MFIGVVSGVSEPEPWTLESTIMAGLIVASALGVLIAWWREGIGGVVVVVCAVAYSTFAYVVAGHNKALAVSVSGGPFLLAGLLFLASWWRSSRSGVPPRD